jgi:Flp pilus assembly protein TadD
MTSAKESPLKTFLMKHQDLLICLGLVLLTLVVYGQVRTHEFVNFDDNEYVTENPHVQTGLTVKSIAWAFTSTHMANWHPVTWLSHMLDCQFFGLNPGWHHLMNVLFHAANTLLLFLVLKRMTAHVWRSAFVAALFALHPLHVESVAWLAERKDVLSTFFWMLTIWSYVRYVEGPSVKRYLMVLLFFILGLMAKPMVVTLPFVLLLLDYWPLGRFRLGIADGNRSSHKVMLHLVREKIPFFFLAVISSVVTFFAQQTGGAVTSLHDITLDVRITNAVVIYISYIWKMIWPYRLAVFYPHPGLRPWWEVAGACLSLAAISLLALRVARRHPYFAVGWLWYIGTLVPVIGLVQIGGQGMADRYTYVPLIGIFLILVWGIPEILAERTRSPSLLSAVTVVLLVALMATSWVQVRHWKDSTMLFEHALAVTSNNYLAHDNLGFELASEGEYEEAIRHHSKAVRINPEYPNAQYNLGAALAARGDFEAAILHYREALRLQPGWARVHNDLGAALTSMGKLDDAIVHYSEAVKLDPFSAKPHNNLGVVLLRKRELDKAVSHFRRALEIQPDYALAQKNLRDALEKHVDTMGATPAIERGKEVRHLHDSELHYNRGEMHRVKGELDEAVGEYEKALSIQPTHIDALNNLGVVYAARGEYQKARRSYLRMIELQPDNHVPYYNLACLYSLQNNVDESAVWLEKAISKGFNDWNLLKADRDLENIRNSPSYRHLLQETRDSK